MNRCFHGRPSRWCGQKRNRQSDCLYAGGNHISLKHNHTPLHRAVSDGNAVSAKTLIENGADVNARNEVGESPLHDVDSHATAKILIDGGADVNARDGSGETPLHDADSPEMAKVLLDNGSDVNARDKDGNTPLHDVAIYNDDNVELAKILIEEGADVNARNKDGDTPLDEANSRSGIAALLRSKGAISPIEEEIKELDRELAQAEEEAQIARWKQEAADRKRRQQEFEDSLDAIVDGVVAAKNQQRTGQIQQQIGTGAAQQTQQQTESYQTDSVYEPEVQYGERADHCILQTPAPSGANANVYVENICVDTIRIAYCESQDMLNCAAYASGNDAVRVEDSIRGEFLDSGETKPLGFGLGEGVIFVACYHPYTAPFLGDSKWDRCSFFPAGQAGSGQR